MQVLVIGVGFIGTALCAYLTQQGHSVITVDRGSYSEYQHYQLDARCSSLARVFLENKIDTVVHLAAEVIGVAPAQQDFDTIVKQNMCSLFNSYTAAMNHKAKKFVFSSTIAIKGETLSAYACSKLMGEKLLRVTDQRLMQTASVRLTNVYGVGQSATSRHESLINKAVRYAVNGGTLIMHNSTAERDYLYIDDAVAALGTIATVPTSKTMYEVGCGMVTSVADAVDLVKQRTAVYHGSDRLEVVHECKRSGDAQRTEANLSSFNELYASLGKTWTPIPLTTGIDKLLKAI